MAIWLKAIKIKGTDKTKSHFFCVSNPLANKNIPKMVNQISYILAKQGVNILNMLNRYKNEIAYNIIDIEQTEVDPASVEELKAIDGVFMARILDRVN